MSMHNFPQANHALANDWKENAFVLLSNLNGCFLYDVLILSCDEPNLFQSWLELGPIV